MDYTIYFIENEVNHKGYVGMTSQTVDERFEKHTKVALRGADTVLHRAIRKHGPENFTITPLTWASTKKEAGQLEEEWIDWLAQERFEILGPEGGTYSEEPIRVYARLEDLLRQYLDGLGE